MTLRISRSTRHLARGSQLRTGSLEFNNISLNEDDVNALVASLRALTEDYNDA